MTKWGSCMGKFVIQICARIVANAEKHISQNLSGRKLNKWAEAPWPSNYTAEDDTMPELDEKWANYYQHLIGILHWTLELGRVTSSPRFQSLRHRWQHHGALGCGTT